MSSSAATVAVRVLPVGTVTEEAGPQAFTAKSALALVKLNLPCIETEHDYTRWPVGSRRGVSRDADLLEH